MYLCYNKPASSDNNGWREQSLPLGNGSIGARIFGGIQCEMIQFNEKTLFSGDSEKIGSFQNLCEMFLNFNTPVPCSENTYLRDLDLETGSAMVACRKGLDGHTRHYFISAPDNVFAGKIESTGDTLLDFTLSLQSEQNGEISYDGDCACIRSTVNANNGAGKKNGEDKNSLEYVFCVKVMTDDGDITADESGITVKNTFCARIIASCTTSYFSDEELNKAEEYVSAASERTFPKLFKNHLEDYKSIMGKLKLNIGQTEENMTADMLFKAYRKGRKQKETETLLFEYGKYILYASSRRKSLPIAESGIWNNLNKPENGEILIDTRKARKAYRAAYMMNMEEVSASYKTFILSHKEEKRYNPFGAFKECKKKTEEKKRSLFGIFNKSCSVQSTGEIIGEAERLLKNKKEKEAHRLLSESAKMTYSNLLMPDIFDNIAFSECICKMLVCVDESGIIHILSAVPDEWESGKFGNIITENGFEIGFEWSQHHLKSGTVKTANGGECKIYAHGKFVGISDEDGNDVNEKFENGVVSFYAEKGKTYRMY